MLISGQPSVRRSGRNRRGRNKRVVIPVAAVVALGLGAGVFVAASGGGSPARVRQAASSSQGVSSSAVNTNCDIVIPAHPLTAKGLATPFLLTGPAGTSPAASGCQ